MSNWKDDGATIESLYCKKHPGIFKHECDCLLNKKPRNNTVSRLKNKLKANPNINLTEMNIPRTNGEPTPRLKDILETEVEERYYLRNDIVEKIVQESKFQERLVSMKMEKK